MSRDLCIKCGEVFSTTASPNNTEGYFISDINIEEKADDMLAEQKAPYLREVLKAVGERAIKCPKCGNISQAYHADKHEEEPGVIINRLRMAMEGLRKIRASGGENCWCIPQGMDGPTDHTDSCKQAKEAMGE